MRVTVGIVLSLLLAAPALAQEGAGEEDMAIADAKGKVQAILEHGDKARFEYLTVRSDAEGRQVVCGRVDRPNAEGNYVNQRYFAVTAGVPRLFPRVLWQEAWKSSFCGAIPEGVHELTEEELQQLKLRDKPIVPSNPVLEE